jgi:hypothetical protein
MKSIPYKDGCIWWVLVLLFFELTSKQLREFFLSKTFCILGGIRHFEINIKPHLLMASVEIGSCRTYFRYSIEFCHSDVIWRQKLSFPTSGISTILSIVGLTSWCHLYRAHGIRCQTGCRGWYISGGGWKLLRHVLFSEKATPLFTKPLIWVQEGSKWLMLCSSEWGCLLNIPFLWHSVIMN